ncbi:MAG TPA: F0F1 ATP synthase subunit A [Acidimicrobiales bacterium]|nr:F0F1 ATP synthase subunit A [Acidimicrobiales bacterium]
MSGALAVTIPVGDHITRRAFGMTFDVDTIVSTLVAGVLLLGFGLYVRHRATSGVPGKAQLAFESIVGSVEDQVRAAMGDAGRPIVPLAVTLFIFILLANWLELLPTGHTPQYLPAPTGDINFPLAMAAFVIIAVHATWIRRQGIRSYLAHYFRPFKGFVLFNVIEEAVKPITLTLRLFGNIFAGGLMLVLIAELLPVKLIVPIPLLDTVWKLFDGLFVGPIQAFIFALLTILYFESAVAGTGH